MNNVFYRPKRGEGMYYVANGTIQVTGDDIREVGAEVPEAFDWSSTPALVNQGRLMFMPAHPPKPVQKKVEPKKSEPTNPGLDAKSEARPSLATIEASKSGADPAKPEAKRHGKPKDALK